MWKANVLRRFDVIERDYKEWEPPEFKMEYIHVDNYNGFIRRI